MRSGRTMATAASQSCRLHASKARRLGSVCRAEGVRDEKGRQIAGPFRDERRANLTQPSPHGGDAQSECSQTTWLTQHNTHRNGVMNRSHRKSSGIQHGKVPLLMQQHDVVRERGNDHDAQIFKRQNPAISARPAGF